MDSHYRSSTRLSTLPNCRRRVELCSRIDRQTWAHSCRVYPIEEYQGHLDQGTQVERLSRLMSWLTLLLTGCSRFLRQFCWRSLRWMWRSRMNKWACPSRKDLSICWCTKFWRSNRWEYQVFTRSCWPERTKRWPCWIETWYNRESSST